jgi:hypothetical protein
MVLGSGIPDPGVKKHPIPDPGSATLVTGHLYNPLPVPNNVKKIDAVNVLYFSTTVLLTWTMARNRTS